MATKVAQIKISLAGAGQASREAQNVSRSLDRLKRSTVATGVAGMSSGRQVGGLRTQMGVMRAEASRSERATRTLGDRMRGMAGTAKLGALAFAGLGTAIAKGAIDEYREAYKVGQQTEAVIKSTGGAANITADQVGKLASSLSLKTGLDDETIQSGSNLLLTFKKIRNEVGKGNDVFDRATAAAVDLSAAGFGSIDSTSKQLGKALNDPVKGMSALGRAGVTFTKSQEDVIKKMVKTGDVLGAQKIILREVESQVKGSAEAQADPIDRARVAWGNLLETLGTHLAPVITSLATTFADFIQGIEDGTGAGGTFRRIVSKIGDAIVSVRDAASDAHDFVADLIGDFKDGEPLAVALGIAVGSLAAGVGAYAVLAGAAAIKTALFSGAVGVLNAVMALNPIFLVVAGLAAIAAGFYIAYQKVDWFRNIVDTTFSWIRDNWPLLLAILTGPIGIAVYAIIRNWDRLKGAVSTVVGFVSDRFGDMVSTVKGLPSRIAGVATGMFDGIRRAALTAIRWIRDMFNKLVDFIGDIPGRIAGVVGDIAGMVGDIPIVGGAARGAAGALGGAFGFITGSNANGGPISAGGTYLVGEEGPELITPSRDGYVHTAPETARMFKAPAPSYFDAGAAGIAANGAAGGPTTLHHVTQVMLGRRVLAEAMDVIRLQDAARA